MKIGFLVNPIAGMGGKVGLKGTDGVLKEAIERGAFPVSKDRAKKFLNSLKNQNLDTITLLPGPGPMGTDIIEEINKNKSLKYENIFRKENFELKNYGLFKLPKSKPEDTIKFAKKLKDKVDILVFVGGDGTARDIHKAVNKEIPILGIPSGVKVYSSVFSSDPKNGAQIISKYIKNKIDLKELEIVDIDEDSFRKDEFNLNIYGYAKVPYEPARIPGSKNTIEVNDSKEKEMISKRIIENIEDDEILILGPGTTVGKVKKDLGINPTLLGVDLVKFKKGEINSIHKDLREQEILKLLNGEKNIKIIISPIGGQGYILGRGNQQISPKIIETVGKDNIKVISTLDKIKNLKRLRIDTGKEKIDNMFKYIKVIVGYHDSKLMKIKN